MPASAARPAEVADPLLACLTLLTHIHERPASGEALLAGLPLVEGRLTPNLFARAAERAGLAARTVALAPERFARSLLPAVALLKGRGACLVLAVDAGGELTVIEPAQGKTPRRLAMAEFAALYDGHVILVKPRPEERRTADGDAVVAPRHWFWGTLALYWPIYFQVVVAALFVNSFAVAVPLITLNVYDRVVPNHALETLWVLAIGGGSVLAFDLIMRALRAYLIDLAGRRADVILSSAIMQKVLDMQLAARPQSAGSFASHLRDFEQVREFFTSATLASIIDLPFGFVFLFVIWYIGGPIVVVGLTIIPLVILIGFALQIPLNRSFRQAHKEAAQKHGLLVEIIGGLETIKGLGATSRMQRRWELLVGESARVGQKSRFYSGLAVNISALAQQFATIATLVAGVYVIKHGDFSTGGLVACTMLTGRAMAPLGQVANLLTRFHSSMTALRGIGRIMALPAEHAPAQRFLNRPIREGEIEFRKVTFAYPGASFPSVENVSFRIRPGERVAIIGRIGSGKSTLARLLLNLYQPREGAVLVDGADVRQIDPADLRRGMGLVPQDIFLFQGSVRDNIVMRAPHVEDEQLLRVAKLAGVDDFVAQHPQGYDLQIGERGERLSGGQRQAIVLARAMIGDPPILVLDEPTSAMDTLSEQRLQERIRQYMPGKTIVLITHRISLLSLVERVMVMDGGRIVADGPRDKVLQALSEGKLRAAP
ncbi:MAG: type I secretion system permease/ATPase [Alphaproteobacteria bacterium]|nr:type I secretion system permease/ATPase [Alphaproteobacteria bacterium]